METKFRYAYNRAADYPGKRGPKWGDWRYPTPWKHDCHYAYLRHRAQARYRGEQYAITEQEWMGLWNEGLWNRRGRAPESICLARIVDDLPWCIPNVHFITRYESIRKTHRSRTGKL